MSGNMRALNDSLFADDNSRLLEDAEATGDDLAHYDDDDWTDDWVLPKENTIIPLFTAGLSILGSYVILREVLTDHKQNKRGLIIPRLLMSLSVADLFFSCGSFLSTFVSPRDLTYIWGNIGTVATCEIQGFLLLVGYVASPLFNAALAATYVSMVRYNATDQKLKTFEPFIHGLIWCLALMMAIIPLPYDMYNNAYEVCWVTPAPDGCKFDESIPCERGEKAEIYENILSFFPVWPCIIVCAACMCLMWCTVREMENANAKYANNFHSSLATRSASEGEFHDEPASFVSLESAPDRTKSNTVGCQAILYILAFFVTYFPWLLDKVLWLTMEYQNDVLALFAFVIFLPLQGFLNCLVFVRQREMKTPEGRFFRSIVCCCNYKDSQNQKRRQSYTRKRKSAKKAATRRFGCTGMSHGSHQNHHVFSSKKRAEKDSAELHDSVTEQSLSFE